MVRQKISTIKPLNCVHYQLTQYHSTDLLMCKIETYGQRAKVDKQQQDALDAEALTLALTKGKSITIN